MKRNLWLLLLVFFAVLLSACAVPTPQHIVATVEVERVVEKIVEVEVEKVVEKTIDILATPLPSVAGGNVLPAVPAPRANRLIVKNADLQLTVQSTDVAIDRLTQVVSDVGGYIVSSRVWYQS